jgi:hypothetical protein
MPLRDAVTADLPGRVDRGELKAGVRAEVSGVGDVEQVALAGTPAEGHCGGIV